MKPEPKIGQRWIWDDPSRDAIAIGEVVNIEFGTPRVKVIQVIKGRGVESWGLGETLGASFFLKEWEYLPGQDKQE